MSIPWGSPMVDVYRALFKSGYETEPVLHDWGPQHGGGPIRPWRRCQREGCNLVWTTSEAEPNGCEKLT